MTSYQRRKREIKFLEQCIVELEDIVKELAKELKEKGLKVRLLGLKGISGDTLITPYNNGEFLSSI